MGAIGQPIDRRDGPAKVTGAARYTAEFAVPDAAYAVLVQSAVAAGTIAGIDTAPVMAMPGVLLVVTPDNALRLKQQKGSPQAVMAPALQDRGISFSGQTVAVVVADTLDRALDAAAHVGVLTNAGSVIPVMDQALDRAYVPKAFRNGARPPASRRGDPDAAFAAAPVRVAQRYATPVEHHNPMEPHATIAKWDSDAGGDRLTVWMTTQAISGAQKTLATAFGLAPERVRVICPFVGGGFGSKGNCWPPTILAAMAAKMARRPVKLVLTRKQMYTSNGYRPRTIQDLKLGAATDGALTALRHDGMSQMSRGDFGEFCEPVALASEMLYAVPNNAVSHRLVAVNQGLPTYMRAPGEAPGVFALECAMDELAYQAKIDPLQLRLRNYTEWNEHEDKPFSAKKLRDCYQRGAESFGWSRRSMTPGSMRDGHTLIGWGMATATYPMNRMPAKALVRLDAGGHVLVQTGSQDLGTGTYTILAQIAAETLGVPVAQVRVELGDSKFPPAPVSGGSMTTASVGPAVLAGSRQVRDQLLAMAAAQWKVVAPQRLVLDRMVVSGPAGTVSAAELMAARKVGFVEATGEAKPGDGAKHASLHSFGAQFCEVRVDPDLGEIRVSRFVGAFDAGRVMNAKTARSQAIGGIVFGIGMALLEETVVDRNLGRIVNPNVAEYLLPVNADIPDIQTILIENDDQLSNPLGARGLGELPMVGAAAAVANAVFHATGKRVRELPIRIEDVMA